MESSENLTLWNQRFLTTLLLKHCLFNSSESIFYLGPKIWDVLEKLKEASVTFQVKGNAIPK